MSRKSVLKEKSFGFAVRVINLYRYLKRKHGEYIICQQVIRSGTAIGALIREAEYAESLKDFTHKLYIGLKEANETVYWLDLLVATGFISNRMHSSITKDANELVKMLISSIKTIKNKKISTA